MKKFLTFVLVLAMVMSVSSIAYAADVTTEQELKDAIVDGNSITLGANIALSETLTIPVGFNVTLNLGGYTLSFTTDFAGTTALIENKGTLTIEGTGKISNTANNPDTDWDPEGFPTYANNTIKNSGKLTVNGGTIENNSVGGACYAIDNYTGGNVEINGGEIINHNNVAIRQFIGGNNKVTINGGTVTGKRAVWMQLANNDPNVAPNDVSLKVTGGTLSSNKEGELAIYLYSYGNSTNNVNIDISGGTFNSPIGLMGGEKNGIPDVSISGGSMTSVEDYSGNLTGIISGGEFSEKPADELLDNSAIAVGNNADGFTVLQKPDPTITNDPAFVVIPTSYSFGSTVQGTPFGAKTFTVYNSGGYDIEVKLPDFGENCIVKWADDSVANKTLSTLNGNSYSAEFTVQPNANLAAGKHTAKADVIAYHNSDEFDSEEITAEFTITAPATSSSGGYYGPDVWYIGGNTFGTNTNQVPTSVEIDQVPVSFTMNGSQITVDCITPGAKWVKVSWGSTTNTRYFTPDANAYCAQAVIPKTGDMSFWAAIAQFLGF